MTGKEHEGMFWDERNVDLERVFTQVHIYVKKSPS